MKTRFPASPVGLRSSWRGVPGLSRLQAPHTFITLRARTEKPSALRLNAAATDRWGRQSEPVIVVPVSSITLPAAIAVVTPVPLFVVALPAPRAPPRRPLSASRRSLDPRCGVSTTPRADECRTASTRNRWMEGDDEDLVACSASR